jgi:hypothetical protein
MRLTSALILAAGLAAAPALAQDAATPAAPAAPASEPAPAPIAAADIGPNIDRDFWCGTALGFTAYIASQAGDEVTARADSQKSQMIIASIVAAMKAGNFSEPQFKALSAQYSARLMNPFAPPEDGFARDVCDAAASEAEIAVAAAAKEAESAAPATDAPSTAAPAADAPAAQ